MKNTQNTHQFKSGEHALLEVKISYVLEDDCIVDPNNESFEVDCCLPIFAKKAALHPVPREGEHRLTVEEIVDIGSFADDFAVRNLEETGKNYWVLYREAVEQWLANRKEDK